MSKHEWTERELTLLAVIRSERQRWNDMRRAVIAARDLSAEVANRVERMMDECTADYARRAKLGPCPNDTNGDGDCGQRLCPWCGTAE